MATAWGTGGASGVGRLDARQVFEELKSILGEIMGQDVVDIIGVTPDSEFVRDLEMDSIKIIAFSERVNARFGERVDFMAWLSKKPIRKLIRLRVGDVADVIAAGK
ncbi:MAG: acyl carrier protein [Clostridiales Family XIII bacterium]|jgi:acyl carrier protein|nr:acyl carrier protein [Clostridiales Family XIII bacterium]